MKNTLCFIFLNLIVLSSLSAQQFNHVYLFGDDFVDVDNGIHVSSHPSSILIDDDGSTVSVHNITEGNLSIVPTSTNVQIIKVDINGALLWSKRFGGEGYDDRANAICHTDDGGYLVVGTRGKFVGYYRNWIFRLDADGNIMWERLYPQDYTNSESLLIQRTFETEENYFVAGKTFPHNKITAMKISATGDPYWHYKYVIPRTLEPQSNELVTSMVQDTRFNGYALAGLEFVDREIATDLFTIGIGLEEGNIYRDYRSYGLPFVNTETEPHIIENINQDAFMMTFGSNPAFDPLNATIAMMPVNPDLSANFTFLYNPETERKERPSSIYADPNGYYAFSYISYDDTYIINGSDDRSSFLRVNLNGLGATAHQYNINVDATCTSMAQDLINGHYVLKTDLSLESAPAAGLIRTSLEGTSACAVIRENIDPIVSNVNTDREYFVPESLNTNSLYFPSEEWNMETLPINCGDLDDYYSGSEQRTENIDNTVISDKVTTNHFVAFPNPLNKNTSKFTVEFSAEVSEKVTIKIVSAQGQVMENLVFFTEKGINRFQISTDKLPIGVNTLLLTNNDNTNIYTRLIKF